MNITRSASVFATLLLACFGPALADNPQFQTLFDGSSLDGWSHKGNWVIDEGVITRQGKGGSLIYTALTN